jgi:hypothetical protein
MKKAILTVFFLVFLSSTASATIWQVDAISTEDTNISDFWVTFDDSNDDLVVALGNLIDFSELTYYNWTLDTIQRLPDLSIAFSSGSESLALVETTSTGYDEPSFWTFDGPSAPTGGLSISRDHWTYSVSSPDPIPEPTTMLLLGVGMIGLAGLSRKKFFKKD